MQLPDESARKLLVFRSGGLDCALPLEAVREIVPMATLSEPPALPSGLAGFLDLRGTAIPILRLHRLFSLPEQQPGLHTPIVVLRGVIGPIGFLVDSVRSIVPVSSLQLLDLPADRTFRGSATATFQLDGDLIHLLSPVALLNENEERLLADYGAMSEVRLRHLMEANPEERSEI